MKPRRVRWGNRFESLTGRKTRRLPVAAVALPPLATPGIAAAGAPAVVLSAAGTASFNIVLGVSSRFSVLWTILIVLAAGPSSATPSPPAPTPVRPVCDIPVPDLARATTAIGDELNAYVVEPVVPGHRPGVVVVHLGSRLGDGVRVVADRIARAGYAVVVPDLYRGKGGTEGHRRPSDDEALHGVNVAIRFLATGRGRDPSPDVTVKTTVSVVGVGEGARIARLAARRDGALSAVVILFPPSPAGVGDEAVAVATLVIVRPEEAQAWRELKKAPGREVSVVAAAGTLESFAGVAAASDIASEEEWRLLLGFLAARLPTAAAPGD